MEVATGEKEHRNSKSKLPLQWELPEEFELNFNYRQIASHYRYCVLYLHGNLFGEGYARPGEKSDYNTGRVCFGGHNVELS